MYWAYSEDGGESWKQSDIPFIGGFGSMFDLNSPLLGLSSILDKEWMGTDRSNSAFRGNVYVAMAELKDINTSSPKSTIVLYQKPFDSANFIPIPTKVNQLDYDDMQFASIDVDNSGRIHITFWAVKNNTNYLFHSVSTDGGKSFSKEVLITPFILAGSKNMPGPQDEKITGITSARMYPCPQLAIDKSNNSTSGNIYFTFTAWGLNSRSQSGADIYFTKSIDGGDTWSVPVIVNDDDKKVHSNQFYSSLSVNEDGVIAVSWYDTRNDKNDNVTDYYSTFSFDGGSSFINNFKINSFSTPFSTIGQMNNDFGIGEYNPLLMSKGYLISIWADGRKADGDLDVYSSFIPVSSQTGVERTVPVSSEYKLYEISPNPSENQLTIHFYLDKPGEVIIGFYDLTGKLIQNLKSENVSVGDNHINISLDLLLSGHYYLKLQTLNGFSINKIFIYK